MYKLPTYITDSNFDQTQLNEAMKTGELTNDVDAYSNLKLMKDTPTSTSNIGDYLIAVPTRKRKHIPQQVEQFYDTEFSDFADMVDVGSSEDEDEFPDIEEEAIDRIEEEQLLQAQIDELSDTLDSEMNKNVKFREDAAETFEASRNLIIAQRIASGEGSSHADFSGSFPFLPLNQEQKLEDTVEPEKFPFMGG